LLQKPAICQVGTTKAFRISSASSLQKPAICQVVTAKSFATNLGPRL